MDTLTAMSQLAENATRNQHQLRHINHTEIGDVIQQGDVYLIRIQTLPPSSEKTNNHQIAKGTTQGSRHIIQEQDGVIIYQPNNPGSLDGPIIEAKVRFLLTHPEHANHSIPPGLYRTWYQKDFAKERADELRRVQD